MNEPLSPKEKRILDLIRKDPFVTQQQLSRQLGLSRSAVAGYISALMRKGRILGRAYVLPERRGITCIGGANLDRKARLSGPLQRGTSNPVDVSHSFGGVARNIAENLARSGLDVSLLTLVGEDRDGEALLESCVESGVDVSLAETVPGARTGTYTAVLQPGGEMALALADMEIFDRMDTRILNRSWPRIRAGGIVVADTNLPADTLGDLVRRCREASLFLCVVPVSVPKAGRLPREATGVDLWIGNAAELEAVTGVETDTSAGCERACLILRKRGVRRVVLTCGADGVFHTGEEGEGWLESPSSAKVVDVTGAGDAFAAGVVGSLHRGASLEEACRIGTVFAALTLKTEASVSPELSPGVWHREKGGA
ncbi:pseudouridine kinase [Melghirimyces profundicolus]|uniref:Pseudouridine kinase n=1 Tax=Melghirimyces profundicolus TaxID=1242148 RepID=A0A2T6C916_9BACL|nr:carbohydrate kinase [Melghirimyces profundicolus]PTX64828.1 pseudouridine kinase [Melghirimyces profundicolus]